MVSLVWPTHTWCFNKSELWSGTQAWALDQHINLIMFSAKIWKPSGESTMFSRFPCQVKEVTCKVVFPPKTQNQSRNHDPRENKCRKHNHFHDLPCEFSSIHVFFPPVADPDLPSRHWTPRGAPGFQHLPRSTLPGKWTHLTRHHDVSAPAAWPAAKLPGMPQCHEGLLQHPRAE